MHNTQQYHKKNFVPSTFKLLVAVSSLAGTFGIWNFIAQDDAQAAKAEVDPATPTVENTATLAPPSLPTIVPLVQVNTAESVAQTMPTSLPTATLRAVDAPTAAPVTQNNSNPIILSSDSGGQSSNNDAPPPPVTTTRSSR